MDSIIRGIPSALTVAGGLCNQNPTTIAQYDASRTVPFVCNERRFPIFFGNGGAVGLSSKFTTIELDLNGNIALAGQSTDTQVTSTASPLIIAHLKNQGFNFTWVKELDMAGQQCHQLQFTSAGDKIIALIGNGPLTVVVFSSLQGIILIQVQDQANQFQTNNAMSIAYESSQSGLFIGGTLAGTGFGVLAYLNILNSPTSTSFSAIQMQQQMTVTKVSISHSNGKAYVGAFSRLPQTPPSSTYQWVASVTDIGYSLAGGSAALTMGSTYYNNYYSTPTNTEYIDPGYLFMLLSTDPTVFASWGLLLVRRNTITQQFETYHYKETEYDALIPIGMKAASPYVMHVLFKNTIRESQIHLTVEFPGGPNAVPSSRVLINQKRLHKPYFLNTEILSAYLLSSGEFFFIGERFSSYSSCMTLSAGSVGFIASTDTTQLCEKLQFSQGASYLASQTLTYPFQSYAFASSGYTLTFSSASIANALSDQNLLYQTINTCCFVGVTTHTIPDKRFIIDYPPETYSYPDFTFTVPNQCIDWLDYSFWYKMDSTPLIASTNPIYFFDMTYWLSFTSDTDMTAVSDFYTIGTMNYTITVTGTLPNHQVLQSSTFKIELFNIPISNFITPNQVPSATYIVGQDLVNITWTPFQSSDTFFYIIYYLETQDPNDLSLWHPSFDNDIFVFTNKQRQESVVVKTDDNLKIGIYNMRIVAQYTARTRASFHAESEFQVIIVHQCYSTVITPSKMAQEYIFEMDYPVSSALIIKFSSWKESVGICGPFTYKATLQTGNGKLPIFMTFSPNIKQLAVQQLEGIIPGRYKILLTGYLTRYFMISTTQFDVIVHCRVKQLKPSMQQGQTVSYIVGAPSVMVQIPDFLQEPSCFKEITYIANLAGGVSLPKNLISFENTVNNLGIHDMRIVFGNDQIVPLFDNYTVIVSGIVNADYSDGQSKVIATLQIIFKVRRTNEYIVADYPPLYVVLKASERKLIPFGSIAGRRILQDSSSPIMDLSKYSMEYNQQLLLQLVSSQYPKTSFDGSSLSVLPEPGASSGTRYIVKTLIQDPHRKKFKISQNIILIVFNDYSETLSGGISANSPSVEEQQQQLLDLITLTKSEYTKFGIGDTGFFNSSNYQKNKTQLRARIENVDENGVVTLQFQNPIYVLSNLSLIDTNVLTLEAVDANSNKVRNLNFTWVTIGMTYTQLKLQMTFYEPLSISLYQQNDLLRVTFLEDALFLFKVIEAGISATLASIISVGSNTTKVVNPLDATYTTVQIDTMLQREIPAQFINNTASQALKTVFTIIESGMWTTLVINFVLAVVLRVSMKHVWGIVNFLQIVTHMPLMMPCLPQNYQVVLKLVYDVSRLKIIPKEYTQAAAKWIKGFVINSVSSENGEEDELIDGVGNITICFFVFGLIVLFAAIVGLLFRRVKKVKDIVEKIQNKILFAVFITSIIKGYLNINVKMLGQLTGGGPPFITRTQSEIDSQKINPSSPIVPLIVFSFLATFPFILALSVRANYSKLDDKKFTASFGALYTNLATNKAECYSFNFFFLMRRLLYALCINGLIFVTYQSDMLLNVILQILMSGALIVYVWVWKPFFEYKDNYIEIFNESCILVLFIIPMAALILDDEILSGEGRYLLGFVLIAILLANVIINYTIALTFIIKKVCKKLKNLYLAKCRKKATNDEDLSINGTEVSQQDQQGKKKAVKSATTRSKKDTAKENRKGGKELKSPNQILTIPTMSWKHNRVYSHGNEFAQKPYEGLNASDYIDPDPYNLQDNQFESPNIIVVDFNRLSSTKLQQVGTETGLLRHDSDGQREVVTTYEMPNFSRLQTITEDRGEFTLQGNLFEGEQYYKQNYDNEPAKRRKPIGLMNAQIIQDY